MNDNNSSTTAGDDSVRQPYPWEREPGERLDRYRWFQVYLTLPPPRSFKTVTRILGLKPGSRLVARAARRWSWQERAAASDSPQDGCLALQREWRNQLIREAAYLARFVSLQDSNQALAAAAIGKMDRVAARRNLSALFSHQQGLLRLVAPLLTSEELDMDEQWLEQLIDNRVREILWAEELKIMKEVWGDDSTGPTGSGPGGSPGSEDSSESAQEDFQRPDAMEEDAGDTEPWRQQPGELDKHYDWFRIFLSLMFWQSTEQVAALVKDVRNATVAKIASKWRWQDRAAAFEAGHVDQPLARPQLQDQLLFDKTFDSLLSGLLDSTMAIRNAEIDRMARGRARRSFSALSRHQRNLLRPLWRRDEAAAREALEERRRLLVAPLVEERARYLAENQEIDEEQARIMELIWGGDDDEEDDEDDEQ